MFTAVSWPRSVALVFICAGPVSVAVASTASEAQTVASADQTQRAESTGRLRVYLDCFDCFPTYLRDEIDWVDFVRELQDADVTILSSRRETGGGGRELTLRFVGRGRFAGEDRSLRALSLPAETENARRETVLQTVTVGLLGYLAGAGLPEGLTVAVAAPAAPPAGTPVRADPWNLWVFQISTGGSFSAEESTRESQWRVNASGDRVTDRWKISFGARAENESERFTLDEGARLDVEQRERSANWFLARSLGPHWSLGVNGSVRSSTFGNRRLAARTAPAVEFSVFPYREYATRRLVLRYESGVEYAKYNEPTLFDRLRETLFRHEAAIRLDQRQPWGSLEAGVEFSQYLHDRGKYRIELNGEIDFRVARGLTVTFDGNASRIRDQISLPRRGATPEEVLLRLRQLRSGFQVGFSFGVSYSFGSIFNNVVNPRFGR